VGFRQVIGPHQNNEGSGLLHAYCANVNRCSAVRVCVIFALYAEASEIRVIGRLLYNAVLLAALQVVPVPVLIELWICARGATFTGSISHAARINFCLAERKLI
jgi:hypothetical protein